MTEMLRRMFSAFRGLKQVPSSKCFVSGLSKQWKDFDEKDVKNHVANIFRCSLPDASSLIDSAKNRFVEDRDGRIEILRALRKKGLNIQHVSTCRNVLHLPLDLVRKRIEFSSSVLQDETPSTIMAIIRLNDKDYNMMNRLVTTNHPKLEGMSKVLKLSTLETCQLFVKYPFLIRSKVSTVQSKLDLLSEKGMTLDNLKKDLWVLTYTEARLTERIKEIQKMDIHPIKPWMLRCLPKVIMRTYNYRLENQKALAPYPSLNAFLANRLNVPEDEIEKFAKKYPPVMKVQVSKMKEIIDYLTAEGYSAPLILRTPRILCHSLTTIQNRIDELRSKNYKPKVLSVLCKSARRFNDFVQQVNEFKEREGKLS